MKDDDPFIEYTLVKKCPDGKIVHLNFPDEIELKNHLIAMWQYTSGYSIVAIFKK